MRLLVRAALLCLLLPVLAFAQDSIAGTWQGQIDSAAGAESISLTLAVTDGAVSGSVIAPEGREYSIHDGTIAGGAIQFKTSERSGDETVVVKWVGTVKPGEIAFSRARADGGPAQEFVVTRARQ